MALKLVEEKLAQEQLVYEALRRGDTATVCYRAERDSQWGVRDGNYTNRLRLGYYLWHFGIADEAAVTYLFEEELKDRESHFFQGIGDSLRILTKLLRQYNDDGRYDAYFARAKDANFDCACGYDAQECVVDGLTEGDLLDAIDLCQMLDYRDVCGRLVDKWCAAPSEWTAANRRRLIAYNTYLGREAANEALYLAQLSEALAGGGTFEIIAAYSDVIQYYLRLANLSEAYRYCRLVMDTTDYGQIVHIHLFGDILEACFELTAQAPAEANDLWLWAKQALTNDFTMRYGNLYTKALAAAQAIKDPFAATLMQQYQAWLAQNHYPKER